MSKKLLSFGLEACVVEGYEVTHLPLIEVVPLPLAPYKSALEQASHLILTSKTAVSLFPITEKPVLAVGKETARKAKEKGFAVASVAKEESQEGMIAMIKTLRDPILFWPKSALARPLLEQYCRENLIPLFAFSLYTLNFRKVKLPPLERFDGLYFSSSSTVDAFLALKPTLPAHIRLFAKGEVTKKHLDYRLTD